MNARREGLSLVQELSSGRAISRHVLRGRGRRQRFGQLRELLGRPGCRDRSGKPWPGRLGVDLQHAQPAPEVIRPGRARPELPAAAASS